jgi:hypothetical protein
VGKAAETNEVAADPDEATAAPIDWIAGEAAADPGETTGGVTHPGDDDEPGDIEDGVRSTRRSWDHQRRRRRSPIDEDNDSEVSIGDESKTRG